MTMRRSLRIAVTVDPYIPVPPTYYGGIERMVDLVARGLAERGHQITLFAHPESRTAGTLVPYGAPPHFARKNRLVELWQVGMGLWQRRQAVDVVLSWGRLAALLPILPLRLLPKIQRYCRPEVPWTSVECAARLAGRSIRFTAPTRQVYASPSRPARARSRWSTIHDGVDIGKYHFVGAVPSDAPLIFLGRLEPAKGVHHAIAIARVAGRALIIAGNHDDRPGGVEYFEREIAPHVDGHGVRCVRAVDDRQKNALLGGAAALLFPSTVNETFGIVMAEAMACGTPVIGFDRGSVREVINDGVTGFVCRGVDDAAAAVARLGSINRAAVRADCEARFSDRVMVDAYETLLGEVVGA